MKNGILTLYTMKWREYRKKILSVFLFFKFFVPTFTQYYDNFASRNLEKCNHTVELHIVCKENSCTKTNNYYELLVKESVCNILQFVPTWLIVCTCPWFCRRTNTLVDHIIVLTIKIYMLVSKMSTVLSICKLWQNYKSRKKTVYHYSRLWLTLTGLNFIHFTTITNQVIQLILIMLFGTNVCVRL